MWKAAAFIACLLLGGAAAHAQPQDGGAEDDLAVVKRAVEKEDDAPPRAQVRRTDQARWFRVRIEDRKGAKVKVNLPLGLVRELDDHVPMDWGCGRKHRGCRIRLSEVLDQLDAGEDLVEIKDAEATVRIWVD
jgi:hypothetical protein